MTRHLATFEVPGPWVGPGVEAFPARPHPLACFVVQALDMRASFRMGLARSSSPNRVGPTPFRALRLPSEHCLVGLSVLRGTSYTFYISTLGRMKQTKWHLFPGLLRQCLFPSADFPPLGSDSVSHEISVGQVGLSNPWPLGSLVPGRLAPQPACTSCGWVD